MNDTMSVVLTVLLVTAGLLASANLIREFVSDWRAASGEQSQRRFRSPRTGALAPWARRRTRKHTQVLATSILGAFIPSALLAQQPDPVAINGSTSLLLDPTASTDAPPAPPAESAPLTISTDRPSFSDGTGIVPVGHLQIETGYTFTFRNRGGVETQRHNGPEGLARVALLDDRFELRFITSGYSWARSDAGAGAGFVSTAGWNDITLGFKLKATDQDGWIPRLAIGAQTTMAIGSRGVSNREYEPTLKLIWSYDLGQAFGEDWKGFTLGGNGNLAWPTSGGARYLQGQGSIYLSFPTIENLTGFVEYFVIGPNSKGADAAHYVDFGGVYLLDSQVQLDARVGFGLNQEADSVLVGVGISLLF